MKIRMYSLLGGLALFAGAYSAAAQGSQFFQISGPAEAPVKAFRPDGTLVWSNTLPATNYLIHTVVSLPGGTNWVDYVQIPATPGLNTNLLVSFNPPAGMALIPAGSFTMGDTVGDTDETDAPPTSVTISGFYLDVNLVSLGQWLSIYSYATNHGYSFVHPGNDWAKNYPVETVDWFDAVKWCNARSQQAGLSPVYFTNAALTQIFTTGDTNTTVYVNWTNSGFRLPTEAEWEKAARGGLIGQRFPWGMTISESQANYFSYPTADIYDLGPEGFNSLFDAGSQPYTSPVGYFAPNSYGLYDMAGNVFEWCWDWYGYPLGQPTTTNPTGAASGIYRVFRGGNWKFVAGNCRCFGRSANYPIATGYFGFRCARGL